MTITCLNCGGSGYLSRLGGGGLYYPYKCGAWGVAQGNAHGDCAACKKKLAKLYPEPTDA